MKKFCFCGSGYNSEDEEDQAVEPPLIESLSPSPRPRPNQTIDLVKCRGAFSTDLARFSPDGPAHRVVISFEEQGRVVAEMRVAIDGKVVHEAAGERPRFQEDVKLDVDGMEVDFTYDLTQPGAAEFSFRTWVCEAREQTGEEVCYWLMIRALRMFTNVI